MRSHEVEQAWRAHPSFGFRRASGTFRALTEDELPQTWKRLSEEEQRVYEDEFYTGLLLRISHLMNRPQIVVDIAFKEDKDYLRSADCFFPSGHGQYTADLNSDTIAVVLQLNPSRVAVAVDEREVAVVFDTWDGFYLMIDPAELGVTYRDGHLEVTDQVARLPRGRQT